jgi:drug/metabolite transporter (DMT)-like permease
LRLQPRHVAALSMLGASALLALTTLLAKALGNATVGEPLHPLMVSAGRFVFALIVITAVALCHRPSFVGTPWGLHALRSLCGWLGVSCLFAAAALMPLAEATAISFLNPVAAMALAALLLRERVDGRRWLAAGIALSGALILIRPGTEAFHPAAFVALASAVLTGAELVFLKLLSMREPRLRILVVNNAIGAILSVTAAVVFVWSPPTPLQWALLAFLGVTMLGAQALVIGAMSRADASFVTPFFYATLVFAAAYDLAVFGERPDLLAAIGALVIVAGALVLVRGEARPS